MPATKDQYANRFNVHVAEASVGVPSFVEVPTYASAFSKEAFVIHRLEYWIQNSHFNQLVADADRIMMALTTANHYTTLNAAAAFPDPGIVDLCEVFSHLIGTAANALIQTFPIIKDFTNLPGGGLIVPARPIFVGVMSSGVATGISIDVRGYFTKLELKDNEFLELLDAYRMVR